MSSPRPRFSVKMSSLLLHNSMAACTPLFPSADVSRNDGPSDHIFAGSLNEILGHGRKNWSLAIWCCHDSDL
ncbi:hypothetical protein DFH09DRAFT_1149798 [Mycena vulgaris]|nr:hypothetical protein DFH09DRAFT_1149798 [Mycena vulgaris]